MSRRSARVERALALSLAAIPLFIVSISALLMTLEERGHLIEASLPGAVQALDQQGLAPLAALVLLTTIFLPAVELGALVWVSWRLRAGEPAPPPVTRLLHAIRPWSQSEILVLGMMVAFGKLASVFHMLPGVGCAALVGFLILTQLSRSTLEGALVERGGAIELPRRKPDSLGRTTAFLLAAVILFLPANLLPVMTTRTLVREDSETIFSGVLRLWAGGSWVLALLIFAASIVVPGLKILALTVLVVSSWRRSAWWRGGRARLYRAIEWVGRWSMLDIFVMALLAALVRTRLAGVQIDGGAVAFGAVVVLTMLASASFDPRLIWLQGGRDE
jgi:paraquat-inducible protein A